MKRYPAFEPPEYVNWKPDAAVMESYAERITGTPRTAALAADLSVADLFGLYEGMVRFRLHDIMLKRWVRQGVISKAWLGTGEEAVTVGNCHALEQGDVVGPMIRNAGACHEMGMPVSEMLKAYLGVRDSLTRGRDLHTGDPEHGVIPPISFVASLVPVMAGMALAFKLRGENRVAMTWVGDGAARTGEFHEGLSMAAAQGLPLVVVLQDNTIALGTRFKGHTRGKLEAMAEAYGAMGFSCDGNNIIDVLAASREAVSACRAGEGPAILVARTFRMGGHATHDEAEGRALCSADEFTYWGARDPIGCFEEWMTAADKGITEERLREIESRVTGEVDAAAEEALRSAKEEAPSAADLLSGVYADGTLNTHQGILVKS